MYTSLLLMASLTSGASAPQHACLGFQVYGCQGCSNCSGYFGCTGCSGCWGCQGYPAYPVYYDFATSFGCSGCSGCSGWSGCGGWVLPPGCSAPQVYGSPAVVTSSGTAGAGQQQNPAALQQKVEDLTQKLKALQDKLDKIDQDKGKPVLPDVPPQGKPPTGTPPRADAVQADANQRALVEVELPTDAKLYLDGRWLPSTAGQVRTIRTPLLEPGARYYYELRMEVVRDGQVVQQSRRVSFQGGQRIRATFDVPGKGTTVRVK